MSQFGHEDAPEVPGPILNHYCTQCADLDPLPVETSRAAVASVNEEASNVFGWLSIGCWLIVYTPQFIENYQLKSGEGLSVLFVITWALGDLFNVTGAIMAGLIPTVILLSIYYLICDLTFLFQIYYYRIFYGASLRNSDNSEPSETSPLIPAHGSGCGPKDTPSLIQTSSFRTAMNIPSSGDTSPERPEVVFEWRSQLMGWASALLYLGSRIPQIMKNIQTKCEGLSLALFLFAIAGNTFYVLSICVASMEWSHLIINASWLAGSGLTIFADVYILVQFFRFQREAKFAEQKQAISSGRSELA
ncbi:hypothetical protein BS47DRAFT_1485213 [Hydnum rufescens UP504]|uniref:Uncharacterized protein n=1 Tax=Hydnum rufescens UP504 TaxID=1448309 RepID=A0A9P6DXU9_9AGAM|nr:hypothetical protein BS47DRAFT_1485213 [Hydnum rufescens UP504]